MVHAALKWSEFRYMLDMLGLVAPAPIPDYTPESQSTIPKEDPRIELTSWLNLIDSGNYTEAFKRSSTLINESFSEKTFVELSEASLTNLGKPSSRILYNTSPISPPGLPKGVYRSFIYKTKFENTLEVFEIFILRAEKGAWKVASYTLNEKVTVK